MNEKTAIASYDHLSPQGKCSILISYVSFLISMIFPGLLHLSIFQDFSRPGNSFFVFQLFKVVQGA